MPCWLSNIIERVKSICGYHHIQDVLGQKGIVLDVHGKACDGDFTFTIENIDPEHDYRGKHYTKLHCEITPCERDKLQPFITELNKRWEKEGAHKIKVEVGGKLTWDPHHFGGPKGTPLEIHPVNDAKFCD